MKKIKNIIAFTFFLAAGFLAYPQEDDFEEKSSIEFNFGGKIETAHGFRWNDGIEYSLSRSLSQLKGEIFAGSSYAFISASAEYNYRNPLRTGFRLNEAYYRYTGEIWDISLGRQIIAWGQADGFTLTDVLTAKDSSAFLALGTEDTKLASDSIRLRFFHNLFTFEAVAVPFFTPNKLPLFSFEDGAKDGIFYIELPDSYKGIPINYTKTQTSKPKMFTDTDVAARLSFFLPGIDFSFSGFYGWDKNPKFIRKADLSHMPAKILINLQQEYYKIAMAGFDAAIPVKDITLRLESSWIGDRYFEHKDAFKTTPAEPLKKHQLLMLIGLDWSKNSWFVSTQYFEDIILNHKDDIERPIHKGFVSLNVSKTFLRETLKISASGVVDINYGSTLSTYSVDYALTDNIHLCLGGNIYTKGYDNKGDFSKLNKISSLWLKGTFSW